MPNLYGPGRAYYSSGTHTAGRSTQHPASQGVGNQPRTTHSDQELLLLLVVGLDFRRAKQ
jgi:hypothetical protein